MSHIIEMTPDMIKKELASLNIEFVCHQHKPICNMIEMKQEVPLKKAPFIKNLFYYDKKNNFYYVMALDETKVEKSFWKHFGLSPGNIRLTREDHLVEILKGQKGSLNPFILKCDTANKVAKLIIDQNILQHEYVAFHPNIHSETLELKRVDFEKYLAHINRKFEICNLTEAFVDQKEEKKQEKQPVQQKAKDANKDENTNTLKIEYPKELKSFSKYYAQLITKSEMLDYYNISGCYIFRPWGYSIWEKIQRFIDEKFGELGIQNAYFPMFVSESNLMKEKAHVAGFTPEVAWISKTGNQELQNRIAIRPTSETIMYPAFANWIKSHRDLPLKINQWSNIVRWEFKHPTPFIRTREFLWQEGHTAHENREEASEMVLQALEIYRQVYEDILAIPVIKGVKSEQEKFPGAVKTYTVDTCIPINGRAVQGATSHLLGQNFSKMFDIQFQNKSGSKQLVEQTSFGLTTRTLGVMAMFHSDNKGLILPPKVAQYQIVIIPIFFKNNADNKKINEKCLELVKNLTAVGIRVYYDDTEVYTPGWKYNHWELKGIPVRVEMGPKDLAANQIKAIKRIDGSKHDISLNNFEQTMKQMLDDIQKALFEKAKLDLKNTQAEAKDWKDFITALNKAKIVKTPWCGEDACEESVKIKTKEQSVKLEEEDEMEEALQGEDKSMSGSAKTLCIPINEQEELHGINCFNCGKAAKHLIWWGRSY